MAHIILKTLGLAGLALALGGCAAFPPRQVAPYEQPVLTGAPVRTNTTPTEPALACLASTIVAQGKPILGIAVGDVKDYTGKYSQNEGNTLTQGGALMIYSALGKLGGAVRGHERFDTRIAELELAYIDRRQLGDGGKHQVESGKPAVPWLPYFGGSILRSQYYIVGGITELNYNIGSGGAEVGVSGIGARYRTYTMNIGVDLRIVDTRTLVVHRAVSLQKQITGEEVGAGVYRFFGKDLIDINLGAKNQEPLQLGVRTTIEQGVVELLASVLGIDPAPCLEGRGATSAPASPAKAPVAAKAGGETSAPAPGPTDAKDARPGSDAVAKPVGEAMATQEVAGTSPLQNGNAAAAGQIAIPFEFGSKDVSAGASTLIEKAANEAGRGGKVTLHLVARDTETAQPQQRRELADQRVRAVTEALVARGVAASRISVRWIAAATETRIHRYGAGQQLVATLVVAP